MKLHIIKSNAVLQPLYYFYHLDYTTLENQSLKYDELNKPPIVIQKK